MTRSQLIRFVQRQRLGLVSSLAANVELDLAPGR